MESPLVSVVIPVYNKQSSIKRTLEKALAQTFRNYELVIIDDGSTDKSSEIINGFCDSRIRYIYQENGGVSRARNKGVEYARADLIAFLDADDEWYPKHLENLLALYRKYPEAGLYANAYEKVDVDGKKLQVEYNDYLPKDAGIIHDYLCAVRGKQYPVWTSVSMVKKEIFIKAGGFMEGHNHGEDQALWLKMSMLAPVAWSNYIGATYRKDYAGRLSTQIVKKPDACMLTIDGLLADQKLFDETTKYNLLEFRNKLAIAHAAQCILNSYPKEAKDFLKQARNTIVFKKHWQKWYLLSRLPYTIVKFLLKLRFTLRNND